MTSMHSAARDLMSLGLVALPVADKCPIVAWKPYVDGSQRPDAENMNDWFSRPGVTGVAVLCGPASGGLTVADFDDFGAYVAWRRGFPDVAESLPTVRTHRGAHVWFRSQLKRTVCRDWGELKGSGIVVAPPSAHPDGGRYAWLSESPRWNLPFIEPASVGLLEGVTPQPPTATQDVVTQEIACVAADVSCVTVPSQVLEQLLEATLPTQPGRRNRLVFKLAQALRPHFATADDCRMWVERWHKLAMANLGTPEFTETWRDFTYGFERVQYPRGAMLARIAASVARDAAPLDRLRSACRSLAAEAGGTFFLSCRTAAVLVGGIDHVQACRMLGAMRKSGELVLVERGVRPKASEWRLGTVRTKEGQTA